MAGGWVTAPGEVLTRAELAALYGGNPRAGRVMASSETPNVLLFSDPDDDRDAGGRRDGWARGGRAFRFTGRGSLGDQTIAANQAILDHVEQGRSLRLFVTGGTVPGGRTERHRYVGEFHVDPRTPYRREVAPDRAGHARTVLVFRLVPVGPRPHGRERDEGRFAEALEVAGHSCTVVAHADDDLLFMNPALQRDIDNGWGVRTIVLTAGDAGLGEDYWLEREVGLRAAYAHMCGVADQWSGTDAGLPGRDVTIEGLDERPDVQLVFLRLPDGNLDGSGFPSTGRVSLQRLWAGTAPTCTSVDGGEYPQHEWATVGGGVGSWLQLSWAAPRLVRRVVVHDRPNDDDGITSAILSFSDGSSVDVPDFDDPGPTVIAFAPRIVTWLVLTVTGVTPTTRNTGLAEIQVEGS